MGRCRLCGSHAINHHLHGRDGSDGDLCDVCFWRKRSDAAHVSERNSRIREPMTLDELTEYVASNDYSAELALQHAMLLLHAKRQV